LLQTVLKEPFTQKQSTEVEEELKLAAEQVISYNTLQLKDSSPNELQAMLLAKLLMRMNSSRSTCLHWEE